MGPKPDEIFIIQIMDNSQSEFFHRKKKKLEVMQSLGKINQVTVFWDFVMNTCWGYGDTASMHSLTLAIDRCESGQFHTPDALF